MDALKNVIIIRVVTFVYSYPHHHLRRNYGNILVISRIRDSKLWLILGDFNVLSSPDEKLSFSTGNSTRYNNFNKLINQTSLIDLGFLKPSIQLA